MNKSRLQELCQRRHWDLPEYTVSKTGPAHDPRFTAALTVAGTVYHSPAGRSFLSSKEAQNEAALQALQSLAGTSEAAENQCSHESQPQSYVQRKCLDQPVYECIREGPPEHDASRIALMSLPQEGAAQNQMGFYKNLLQEFTQKEGLSLPIYMTINSGLGHMPSFSSIVEIEGESFKGSIAKSKKQAELSAAKVAFDILQGRKKTKVLGYNIISSEAHQDPVKASSRSTINFQHPRAPSVANPSTIINKVSGNIADGDQRKTILGKASEGNSFASISGMPSPNEKSVSHQQTVRKYNQPAPSLQRPHTILEKGSPSELTSAQEGTSSLLSSAPMVDITDGPTAIGQSNLSQECLLPYKSKLHSYSQKRFLDQPVYECSSREGPPHQPRFKATVMVAGQTFESLRYFGSLREAEQDAAKVALSLLPQEEPAVRVASNLLSLEDTKEVEHALYKNLLQELLQKQGLSVPTYSTTRTGASHMPVFSSTVEINGETFQGAIARTKKQAEISAAKVAWNCIQECWRSKTPGSSIGTGEGQKIQSPLFSQSKDSSSSVKEKVIVIAGHSQEKHHSETTVKELNSATILEEKDNSSEQIVYKTKQPGFPSQKPEYFIKEHDNAIRTITNEAADSGKNPVNVNLTEKSISDSDRAESTNSPMKDSVCSPMQKKVLVYPRKPGLVLPMGATVLPCGDDNWVAVEVLSAAPLQNNSL